MTISNKPTTCTIVTTVRFLDVYGFSNYDWISIIGSIQRQNWKEISWP